MGGGPRTDPWRGSVDWLHRGVQGLGSVFSGYPKSLVFNFQVVLVTVTVW